MTAPIAPCPRCRRDTPFDWERCGWCGAQRLLHHDGSYADHRSPASFRRRLLATLVDIALFAVPGALAALLPERLAAAIGGVQLAAILLVGALLYPIVALGARGWTRGKRLLDIHVVVADGRPLTYPRAAAREGVGKILELLLLPAGVASLCSIPFDRRNQALHDKAARTVVVRGAPVPRPLPIDR